MVKENRKLLNDRFKLIFSELEKRGEIVKNSREKSRVAFAEKLGTKGHVINYWLADKREITYEQAKLLCMHYGVNEHYMFQGEGEMFQNKKQLPKPDDKLSKLLNISFSPNILFTNVEAFSSNTVGVDLWEENRRFHIPGVEGDLIALNINGNSMHPTISSGDMVICQPFENTQKLRDNDIYAIVTKQSVWVKRVTKCYDRFNKFTHLKLISDNHEEFDPFLLEVGEVRSLFKVTKRLTGLSEFM